MTYISIFILSIIGIIQCIYNFLIKKRHITIKNPRFMLGIVTLIIFLFLCIDFPAFIKGGITADVKFEEVNGGKKSIIHTYRDVNGNRYWSGGSLDINWRYCKWFEDKNTIQFLPYSRCILYINKDGYEVYNEWEDFFILAIIMFGMVLWKVLKETSFNK